MDRDGAFGKVRPQGTPPAAGRPAGDFALMPERNLPCIFGGDVVKCP